MWWESDIYLKYRRNRNLCKEIYKRFWIMMYYRDVWNYFCYVYKKWRVLE